MPVAGDPVAVAPGDVEHELGRQIVTARGPREAPVPRTRMANLLVYCDSQEQFDRIAGELPMLVALHPARILLMVGEAGAGNELSSSVNIWRWGEHQERVCGEQITLRARGPAVDRLSYMVRALVIGDLPTNLWWATTRPPALGGPLLFDLSEHVQQIVYDSLGWTDPPRAVAATGAWLAKYVGKLATGEWCVVSDINWRRLKYWRRLLAQALAPEAAPGAIDSISEVLIEHGPHAVVQAWELASWLAARLGWRVQEGRVRPGVEICWRAAAPHGPVNLRIRRLPEGASIVRRMRIGCHIGDAAGAVNIGLRDETHLVATLEGVNAAERTMMVKPDGLAELVGRQLSDRETDNVFNESMAVAQVFAQSLLD